MLKRVLVQVGTFFLLLIITFSSTQSPITGGYINELKGQAEQVMKEEDPLYMEILREKKQYDEEPIDAKVDPVWKAVPGYNGYTVDVQKSFEEMQKRGEFQESKLVFRETIPEVVLKDLPPSPIYRGNSEKDSVGLMINVAWGNEYLPEMLKILKKHEVKATFFLDGSWVKNNPNLAMMIKEEGHEIGNHAYTHPDLKSLSSDRIRDELDRTNEVIDATLNSSPRWFAPPSGSYRDEVVKIAREYNMYTVLWTVDTIDWKNPEPISMANRVINKTESGSLILMHPTSSSLHGLEKMILGIKENGLEFGILSDVLSEKRLPK